MLRGSALLVVLLPFPLSTGCREGGREGQGAPDDGGEGYPCEKVGLVGRTIVPWGFGDAVGRGKVKNASCACFGTAARPAHGMVTVVADLKARWCFER